MKKNYLTIVLLCESYFFFGHVSDICSFVLLGCMNFNSYEDWGVDELIVEDSWKRQVGGDWSVINWTKGVLNDVNSKFLAPYFWPPHPKKKNTGLTSDYWS